MADISGSDASRVVLVREGRRMCRCVGRTRREFYKEMVRDVDHLITVCRMSEPWRSLAIFSTSPQRLTDARHADY